MSKKIRLSSFSKGKTTKQIIKLMGNDEWAANTFQNMAILYGYLVISIDHKFYPKRIDDDRVIEVNKLGEILNP